MIIFSKLEILYDTYLLNLSSMENTKQGKISIINTFFRRSSYFSSFVLSSGTRRRVMFLGFCSVQFDALPLDASVSSNADQNIFVVILYQISPLQFSLFNADLISFLKLLLLHDPPCTLIPLCLQRFRTEDFTEAGLWIAEDVDEQRWDISTVCFGREHCVSPM